VNVIPVSPQGSVTASTVTIYTVGVKCKLVGFQIANTTGTAETITIERVRDATAVALLTAASVRANDTLDYGPDGDFWNEPDDYWQVTGSGTGLRYIFHFEILGR
jgi:hypothetical protein